MYVLCQFPLGFPRVFSLLIDNFLFLAKDSNKVKISILVDVKIPIGLTFLFLVIVIVLFLTIRHESVLVLLGGYCRLFEGLCGEGGSCELSWLVVRVFLVRFNSRLRLLFVIFVVLFVLVIIIQVIKIIILLLARSILVLLQFRTWRGFQVFASFLNLFKPRFCLPQLLQELINELENLLVL